MKSVPLCLALACLLVTLNPAHSATLSNRWSFASDTTDSVGGNTGVLFGDAFVRDGELVLDGAPNGSGADSMGFTTPVDLATNHGISGVTFESWYTDTGSGSWSKLFSFGNGTGGSNIIFNLQQGGSGQGRVQYQGMGGEFNFGPRPALNEEHHLALSITPDGRVNAFIDGIQIDVASTGQTGDGNDLSTLPSSWERIGASNWGDAGMTGTINEFRIWDGVLTAEDIANSYNSGPELLPNSEDDDEDGLGDLWEESWPGISGLGDLDGSLAGPGPGAGTGDFDGDGLTDRQELVAGTDPTDSDTDRDGLTDGEEVGTFGTNALVVDSDGDGLGDGAEVNEHSTDPANSDSDGDLYPDGQEIDNGTDPNSADDPGALPPALAHRYSFAPGAETLDSAGGNTAVLIGDALVQDGQLVLDGAPNGSNADSMGFTDPVDLASNFNATGVTFESWYTDDGSGGWAKLFSFGNGTGGRNIIFNLQQGGSGQGRIQYQGMPESNFGPRPAVGEEHHLALSISPEGIVNAWIDGTQIQASPPNLSGDGNDLSTLPSSWERIGASNWGDAGMTGTINEFRIWQGELRPADVAASFELGPDLLPGQGEFRLTDVIHDSEDNTIDVVWNSIPGRFYTVEWSSDLQTGDPIWTEFADITAKDDSTTVTDTGIPPDARTRFYRVIEWAGGVPRGILFSEDFESGGPGWTASVNDGEGATEWQLGQPVGTTGPLSGAQDSENAYSTNLGDYGANSDISLRSPSIDLTATSNADLLFELFRDADGLGDTASIRFLRASDLTLLGEEVPIDMTVIDDEYTSLTIPVASEAMGNIVVIEWVFRSDATSDTYSGLTIDSIEVLD